MASFRDMVDNVKDRIAGSSQRQPRDYSFDEDDAQDFEENDAIKPMSVPSNPYESESPTHQRRSKTSGFDSLFESTQEERARKMADETSPIPPVSSLKSEVEESPRPIDLTGSAATEKVHPRENVRVQRRIAVVKPDNYEEASEVCGALKAGNVVILDLRNCDSTLSRRFLDFSFGATAALQGQVECPEARIYALSTRDPVSSSEIERAKREGLL